MIEEAIIELEQFQQRISICSSCEKCIPMNNIPSCSELSIPLVVATANTCPLEKW